MWLDQFCWSRCQCSGHNIPCWHLSVANRPWFWVQRHALVSVIHTQGPTDKFDKRSSSDCTSGKPRSSWNAFSHQGTIWTRWMGACKSYTLSHTFPWSERQKYTSNEHLVVMVTNGEGLLWDGAIKITDF